MTARNRSRNRALLRFVLLPMIFLTVALLGGLRIDVETRSFVFVPPPLITLVLTTLLMVLFVRGRAVVLDSWVSSHLPPLTNVSHSLTLLTLFFASTQALNSVLPERGSLLWLFTFFFLSTLLNNLFSHFNARSLVRSLAFLFGTAFFLKHMFLASLFSPGGGWAKWIAGSLLNLSTLGTLDYQPFAPATGYISFFTLALYVSGLVLLSPSPEPLEAETDGPSRLLRAYGELPPLERMAVRQAIIDQQPPQRIAGPRELLTEAETLEIKGEIVEDDTADDTFVGEGGKGENKIT